MQQNKTAPTKLSNPIQYIDSIGDVRCTLRQQNICIYIQSIWPAHATTSCTAGERERSCIWVSTWQIFERTKSSYINS